MNINARFKTKVLSSEKLFGSWVSIPDASSIEVMARMPSDFLLLDGEHAPIRPDDLYRLLPAADLHDKPVVFRPRSRNEADIKAALDAGAAGIMVPMTETGAQARMVVDAACYAPLGKRGIGPLRASRFYDEFDRYFASANDEAVIILQIESREGVENVAEIAAVDGVDTLFVGPADLAQSLGVPLGVFSGALLEACKTVADTARKHGKRAAIDLLSPADIPLFTGMGFSLFTHGSDIGFMQEAGRRTYATLRTALEKTDQQ